jgi:hypothetical protein
MNGHRGPPNAQLTLRSLVEARVLAAHGWPATPELSERTWEHVECFVGRALPQWWEEIVASLAMDPTGAKDTMLLVTRVALVIGQAYADAGLAIEEAPK